MDWLGGEGLYIVIGLVVLALLATVALRCASAPRLLAALVAVPLQAIILLGAADAAIDGCRHREI